MEFDKLAGDFEQFFLEWFFLKTAKTYKIQFWLKKLEEVDVVRGYL